MRRNRELTPDEIIPIDGEEARWSFGIHANEDPSVSSALEELGAHKRLEATLTRLIGRNPAVAEITAITVAPGAIPQGWHSDVKTLGNSLKYAQTFTHSYSLFIPLQDTTAAMGATELCPGTHYCATEDMWDVCVEAGFQAAGPGRDEVWKTGDGLLFNQKVWHRGPAHTGYGEPNRVVFIVTFISRPRLGVDHRQLSHGTYFHIHPRMYGHTFNDLKQASLRMSEPFASLRSLGIWKPSNADWGWDWVMSSATRLANGENGYSFGDLIDFLDYHSIALAIPEWLHGTARIDGGWQLYFKETIDNFALLFVPVYVIVFVTLFGLIVLVDLLEDFKHRRTKAFGRRHLFINAAILLVSYIATVKFRSLPFAKSVENNIVFARPFAVKPTGKYAESIIQDMDATMMDFNLTTRPMTFPEKYDVLFGNRHDSRHIGYYVNFLNFHPGNEKWRKLLGTYSSTYKSYKGLPPVFQERIISIIEDNIDSTGRMLTQTYYGDWVVMNQSDRRNQVIKGLDVGIDNLFFALERAIAILSTEARHGTLMRSSNAMKKIALSNVRQWKKTILLSWKVDMPNKNTIRKSLLRTHWNKLESPQITSSFPRRKPTLHQPGTSKVKVKVGDIILVNYRGTGNWMPAEFIFREFKHYGVAQFFTGQDEGREGERTEVSMKKVRKYRGFKEGDRVTTFTRKCPRCRIVFGEDAVIMEAHPDLTCDIIYTNGRIESRLSKDAIVFRFDEEDDENDEDFETDEVEGDFGDENDEDEFDDHTDDEDSGDFDDHIDDDDEYDDEYDDEEYYEEYDGEYDDED